MALWPAPAPPAGVRKVERKRRNVEGRERKTEAKSENMGGGGREKEKPNPAYITTPSLVFLKFSLQEFVEIALSLKFKKMICISIAACRNLD